MVGTRGPDRLVGTSGPDVVVGRGGRDVIKGLEGNDRICAGRGSDEVSAGRGRDDVRGGTGRDAVRGGRGSDDLAGKRGSDRVGGNRGFDGVTGGWGDDHVSGGRGADFLAEGRGDDTVVTGGGFFHDILMGAGDDAITGGRSVFDFVDYRRSPSSVSVNLTVGSSSGYGTDSLARIERVTGSESGDVLVGNDRTNSFFGLRGDDVISALGDPGDASGLRDIFNGDFLEGGPGDDILDGGDGFDASSYFNASDPIVADLVAGTARGAGDDTLVDIEEVEGSRFPDTLTGDAQDNGFYGNRGDDQIDGGAGTDFARYFSFTRVEVDLRAGTSKGREAGADHLVNLEDVYGGFGPDRLFGDSGPNRIDGAWFDDVIRGRAGDDRLHGSHGRDTLDGGADNDVCWNGEKVTGCESTPAARSEGLRHALRTLLGRSSDIPRPRPGAAHSSFAKSLLHP